MGFRPPNNFCRASLVPREEDNFNVPHDEETHFVETRRRSDSIRDIPFKKSGSISVAEEDSKKDLPAIEEDKHQISRSSKDLKKMPIASTDVQTPSMVRKDSANPSLSVTLPKGHKIIDGLEYDAEGYIVQKEEKKGFQDVKQADDGFSDEEELPSKIAPIVIKAKEEAKIVDTDALRNMALGFDKPPSSLSGSSSRSLVKEKTKSKAKTGGTVKKKKKKDMDSGEIADSPVAPAVTAAATASPGPAPKSPALPEESVSIALVESLTCLMSSAGVHQIGGTGEIFIRSDSSALSEGTQFTFKLDNALKVTKFDIQEIPEVSKKYSVSLSSQKTMVQLGSFAFGLTAADNPVSASIKWKLTESECIFEAEFSLNDEFSALDNFGIAFALRSAGACDIALKSQIPTDSPCALDSAHKTVKWRLPVLDGENPKLQCRIEFSTTCKVEPSAVELFYVISHASCSGIKFVESEGSQLRLGPVLSKIKSAKVAYKGHIF